MNVIALIRCQVGDHELNKPFHWTADGRRFARQVCKRPGCRHWRTYEVPRRSHSRPATAPTHRRRRKIRTVPLLGELGFAWPRAWTLSLAVLAGLLEAVFGGVIRSTVGG